MAERKGRRKANERARDPEAPPPTLGPLVVEWMTRYLVHGPGPVQGRPFTLHDDLELFVWLMYELQVGRSGDARRRVVEAVLTAPKGVAKSELAGALTVAECLGPVMFDGWDANGDPVGREPERGDASVYANDEDQAGNTYANVAFMLDCTDGGACSAELREDYGFFDIGMKVETSKQVNLPSNRGSIRKAASRPRGAEGRKDRFSVLEEPHLMTLPAMHDLHETIVRTARKSGGKVLLPTNLYGPGEGSVLEVLDNDRTGGASDLLWFQRQADPKVIFPGVDLTKLSDKVLREQLDLAYGTCFYVDRQDIIDGLRRPSVNIPKQMRFVFNMKATKSGRWKSLDEWDGLHASKRDPVPSALCEGDVVALGFSGGRSQDGAMLVACRSDGLLVELARWDAPQYPPPDWRVPADEVWFEILQASRKYDVLRVYANPAQWRTDIEQWGLQLGERDVPNSKRTSKVVAEWSTASDKAVAEAIERFDTACLTGQLCHVDDEGLRTQVLHAALSTTNYGSRIASERRGESIQGAWAALMAYEALCDAIAAGLMVEPAEPREFFVY